MSEIRVENIIGETGTDAVQFTKGINTTGVITATSFSGSGSNLTGLASDKIFEGNTEVEAVDTGSDGHIKITT